MKKELLKKLMAASLATAMTVGLAACGDAAADNTAAPADAAKDDAAVSTPATDDAAAAVVEEEEVAKLTEIIDPATGKAYDLGGMEIEIYQWWEDSSAVVDDYSQARADYLDWIQETYNFTIKQVGTGDWGECTNQLIEYSSTGGDDTNKIFVIRGITATLNAMKQGLMYDLSTLDCLDLTSQKYQQSGVDSVYKLGDSRYVMRADACEARSGIFFNKRILAEAGYAEDYLYDLQANGQWTWDKWLEIMDTIQAVDSDNDGTPDIYGTTQNDGVMISEAVYNNGTNYIDFVDGKFVFNLDNPKTLEALEFAKKVLKDYSMPKENWDDYKTFFPQGQAAFMPEEVWAGQPNSFLVDMEDEWGFVCFPAPDGKSFMNANNDNLYVIPSCYDADRAWKIAFAYDLYTEEVPGYEGYEGWKAGYTQTFDDRAIEESIGYLRTHGLIPVHDLVPDIQFGADFQWSINGDADITALVENVKTMWAAAIDAANN